MFFHDTGRKIENPKLCRKRVLFEITEYDRVHGSSYYAALMAYLLCRMSPTQTAQKMFLHKNTILYRINIIEELFSL